MTRRFLILPFFVFLFLISAFSGNRAFGQTAEDLRAKIEAKNKEIEAIEQDIAIYKGELEKIGGEKQTLQSEVAGLNLTRKKLTADISLTQKKIDATKLTIESLGGQITDKEESIGASQDGLKQLLRRRSEIDDQSLAELFLSEGSMSRFWDERSQIEKLGTDIDTHIKTLQSLKHDLSESKSSSEKQHRELLSLNRQLSDQRKIVDSNKKQLDSLLKTTQNKESNYKKLLAEREASRVAFEQEILEYESQIKTLNDTGKIPTAQKLLFPPLDKLQLTQEFGDTAFSREHAGVYNGRGHNGVDFRASPGTPIKASLSGVVVGTGDTDVVCPNASYGKWVMIRHANGLSTLYAHLSLIRVAEGANVSTGEIIGYSGNTGYSTGPHLHFTVYATEGVEIVNRKSRVCKGTYRMPVADLRAYLNPMLYL